MRVLLENIVTQFQVDAFKIEGFLIAQFITIIFCIIGIASHFAYTFAAIFYICIYVGIYILGVKSDESNSSEDADQLASI